MKNKKMLKKLLALVAVVCVVFSMAVPAFAVEGETDTADVAVSAMRSALGEVTGVININNVIVVITAAIGASILLVFFWWGVRKVIKVVMAAFRKGKVSV